MGCSDRKPLQGTPVTQRIAARHNNRLGAVYSALYAFWSARASAQTQAGQAALRRDAYSVIFFDDSVTIPLANNFQSSPDDLLNTVLAQSARGGTDFNTALRNVQNIMETHWSTDRFVASESTKCEAHMLTSLPLEHPLSSSCLTVNAGSATPRCRMFVDVHSP
jgi:hypothetical protein